jgi:LacI family transcriptional regulator
MTKQASSGSQGGPRRQRLVLLAQHWLYEARRQGIVDYARSRGWRLLDLQCFAMMLPQSLRPDGVLFGLAEEQTPLARRLLRLGVPAVHVQDQALPIRCPCVMRDRREIGRVAAEHFAERGFRRLAYVRSDTRRGSPDDPTRESFVEHTRRLGASCHVFALQGPGRPITWTRVGIFANRLRNELGRIRMPVGVFTYHDIMATRICHYCDAAGLSVPEQVAVLGLGNDRLICDLAPVPLSSLDPNNYRQGQVAAELLERLMDGEPAPEGPILVPPAGVVARQSTDVLAVPDVTTARALRYLWEHLAKPLNVRIVAEAVGVSRSKLDQDFRRHLNRSVIEELNRKRIERACELLTGTRQSVVSIARQVGFCTEPYLFRVFRKQTGTTPKKYRLAHTARGGEAEEPETPGRE